jgi:Glycosyl transferase family 2
VTSIFHERITFPLRPNCFENCSKQSDELERSRKIVPINAPTHCEVAVVVPCYNAELHLERALESVFAQANQDFRIFAVDDCSSDETLEILKRYPQCSVTSLKAQMGPSAARNHGIRASRSPFVAFLDADDEWLPRKLERQLAVLKDDPSLGMVCSLCAQSTQGDQGIVLFGQTAKAQSGRLFEKLVQRCFVYTPTVVARRECLEDVGLFHERLRVSEDFNLWLRIAAKWPIAIMPQVLAVAHARPGGLSLSTSAEERFSNGVAALEDVRSRCTDLSAEEFRALQLTLAERIYCYGSHLLATGAARRSREKFAAALKLQPMHSRALVKLGLSFLPANLSKSLLKFGQAPRTQPQPRPNFRAAESSGTD